MERDPGARTVNRPSDASDASTGFPGGRLDFLTVLLDDEARRRIAEAVTEAGRHIRPLAEVEQVGRVDTPKVLTMAARAQTFPPSKPVSSIVPLAFGFRANVSFEEQPIGLCMHLSVSTDLRDEKGQFGMPSEATLRAIAAAFGMRLDGTTEGMSWLEEFEPGHYAVNVVEKVGCPKH